MTLVSGASPLLIAHRGASGYRPEHTLAGYELAARMGADFLEPDLVATKDHVLVARHENEISGTTDVADRPEFADRRTTKSVDGVAMTGWFTEDFTLAEVKTLRARERVPDVRQRNTIYDGRFEIPTLAELVELRHQLTLELGREIGLYIEAKHPTYFREIGLDLESPLVGALEGAELADAAAPVFIQSFEPTHLTLLRGQFGVASKLVFLTEAEGAPFDLSSTGDPRTYANLLTPAALVGFAETIVGIGPYKEQVIPRTAAGDLGEPTDLVATAHAAGLLVHPYTFRAENTFLPRDFRVGADPGGYGRILDELAAHLGAGIDGFFTDHTDIGRTAIEDFLLRG